MNDHFNNPLLHPPWNAIQQMERERQIEIAKLRQELEQEKKLKEAASLAYRKAAAQHDDWGQTTHAIMRGTHDTLHRIEKLLEAIHMALKPRPATGHKTTVRTHKLDTKTGRLEPIKKKLSPNAKYALNKRTKVKRGKRV